MKNLENFGDTVAKYCEGKFKFFNSFTKFSDFEKSVEWNGEDFKEFLALAENLDIKIIYFFEDISYGEEDDEHNGEIGLVEMGFFYNNIPHYLTVTADWFDEMNESEEEDDDEEKEEEEALKDISNKSTDVLCQEMIEFMNKEYENPSEIKKYLFESKRQFWMDKGLHSGYSGDPKIRLKIERVESAVDRHFTDLMRKDEEKLIPQLSVECIKWCKDQGLNKITKTNIRFFLDEKKLSMTSVGEDSLYLRVNHELKRKF